MVSCQYEHCMRVHVHVTTQQPTHITTSPACSNTSHRFPDAMLRLPAASGAVGVTNPLAICSSELADVRRANEFGKLGKGDMLVTVLVDELDDPLEDVVRHRQGKYVEDRTELLVGEEAVAVLVDGTEGAAQLSKAVLQLALQPHEPLADFAIVGPVAHIAHNRLDG